MDHRSDLSDVIVRPSATPHVSVCVCVFIFPKDNQLPRPLSSQHTQTQHRCPNTRTLLEESFYFFIWAPVGACLRCSAPSSSLFFSSSSLSCSSLLLLLLLSPLALPLSHSLGFLFFFSSSILCRLYLTEGPVPRSHPRAPSATTL